MPRTFIGAMNNESIGLELLINNLVLDQQNSTLPVFLGPLTREENFFLATKAYEKANKLPRVFHNIPLKEVSFIDIPDFLRFGIDSSLGSFMTCIGLQKIASGLRKFSINDPVGGTIDASTGMLNIFNGANHMHNLSVGPVDGLSYYHLASDALGVLMEWQNANVNWMAKKIFPVKSITDGVKEGCIFAFTHISLRSISEEINEASEELETGDSTEDDTIKEIMYHLMIDIEFEY